MTENGFYKWFISFEISYTFLRHGSIQINRRRNLQYNMLQTNPTTQALTYSTQRPCRLAGQGTSWG